MKNQRPESFNNIIQLVKQPEFYVPRGYQTIGGMWTVDTWQHGDVTVQVMDEGYTIRVMTATLSVYDSYPSGLHYELGNEELLNKVWEGMK